MATAQLAPIGVGIKNVLIATDFSHHSDAALRYGLEFAHLYGARAEIVYVVPTEEFVLAGPEGLHAAREAARRDLLEFKARLGCTGALVDDVDYHLAMLEGPVADCLLQCAREKKSDLLVVGTHGRRGLGKFVLGSVVEKVFRHSPVPVLTVGPHIHLPHKVDLTRHILAPCDLTPKSHPAVQYACTLAQAQHAQLTVLHVVERLSEVKHLDPYGVKQEIKEQLADVAGRIPEGVDVRYQVEFGNVAATVLGVASESSADLIVVGVRPSSGVLDRFMWPIAYELVREAACPVLTIRGSVPVR
jgi:nucleotide-binding universal stress UspA family protein